MDNSKNSCHGIKIVNYPSPKPGLSGMEGQPLGMPPVDDCFPETKNMIKIPVNWESFNKQNRGFHAMMLAAAFDHF